jgi:hypothetical protein
MPAPRSDSLVQAGNPGALALEATALRYAARSLPPVEIAAFEAQLAGDPSAREALSEAVRLSAAALGQESPAPDHSFRAMIREKLHPLRAWYSGWLARRAYRGHPLAWTGIGGGIAAAALLAFQYSMTGPLPVPAAAANKLVPTRPPTEPTPAAPDSSVASQQAPIKKSVLVAHDDSTRKAAVIWAELSTPEHVEKSHDDEARLHQRFKNFHPGHVNQTSRPMAGIDLPE